MRLLLSIAGNAVALYATTVVPGIVFTGTWLQLLVAGAIFGLLNFIVRPLALILSIPALVLTRSADVSGPYVGARRIELHHITIVCSTIISSVPTAEHPIRGSGGVPRRVHVRAIVHRNIKPLLIARSAQVRGPLVRACRIELHEIRIVGGSIEDRIPAGAHPARGIAGPRCIRVPG